MTSVEMMHLKNIAEKINETSKTKSRGDWETLAKELTILLISIQGYIEGALHEHTNNGKKKL